MKIEQATPGTRIKERDARARVKTVVELQRHVIPLGTRLVMVERKLIDQAANPKCVKVYGVVVAQGGDEQGKYAVIEVPQ